MRRRNAAALLLCLGLTACQGASQAATSTPTGSASATPSRTADATPSPSAAPDAGPKGSFTLAFAGDIHFEGPIQQHLHAHPRGVLAGMAPTLRAADLAIANLETAITDRGSAQTKQFVFRAPATAFTALRAAGIDVVTNANNHGLDYGQTGFADTMAAARRAGFPLVGSGPDEATAYAPYRVTLHGNRVALLGASQVIAPNLVADWTAGPHHPGIANGYNTGRLLRAVRAARTTSDVVVVYLHWGVERDACPSSRQRTLARQLVAAGADVVVGSHAHVVQGDGRLGRAYVAYGLGNFLFYAHGGGPSTLTSVLTLTLRGRTVTHVQRTPARLANGWTTPLTGGAATRESSREQALRGCAGLTAP